MMREMSDECESCGEQVSVHCVDCKYRHTGLLQLVSSICCMSGGRQAVQCIETKAVVTSTHCAMTIQIHVFRIRKC